MYALLLDLQLNSQHGVKMALANEILGLISDIHDSLRARGETLSTAESLTAGGLSNALTIVPGASDVFLGSITAYRPDSGYMFAVGTSGKEEENDVAVAAGASTA